MTDKQGLSLTDWKISVNIHLSDYFGDSITEIDEGVAEDMYRDGYDPDEVTQIIIDECEGIDIYQDGIIYSCDLSQCQQS